MKKLTLVGLLLVFLMQSFVIVLGFDDVDYKDYREVRYSIEKPIAQFKLTISNGQVGISSDRTDAAGIGYAEDQLPILTATVGDTIQIQNLSIGKNFINERLDMYNFQASIPEEGMNTILSATPDFQSAYQNFTLEKVGTYNFYLCVRAHLSPANKLALTDNRGNWSENGNHRAKGVSPDGNPGYWYFTQVRVVVGAVKPVADFTINHKGINVTDNETQPVKRTNNTLQFTLQDKSTISNGIIKKREWKYWDASTGITMLPNQGNNDTTLNVDTTGLNVNLNQIVFYLYVTSDKEETSYKTHKVYSINSNAKIIVHHKSTTGVTLAPDDTIATELDLPTKVYSKPINGYLANKTSDTVTVPASDTDKTVEYTFTYSVNASAGTIIVHHKDTEGNTLAPDDKFFVALDTPTEVNSVEIPNYTASKVKDTVTVPASDPDKTIDYTFTYTKNVAASQVIAVIDAPSTAVMGNNCYFSGKNSYTKDPSDTINTYQWRFSLPYVIVSGFTESNGVVYGMEGVVYFTQPGENVAELKVLSAKGSGDDNEKTIITPPYPNTTLTALDTRVNHKLTGDASTSTSSSQRYPIDWNKTEWEISIADASKGLSLNDIKTLHTYTLGTNSQGKQVIKIKGNLPKIETLSKKEGKVDIYCKITTTAGYSAFAQKTVNIGPDLPPVTQYSYNATSLRDPNDNNYASFDLIDLSYSADGDTIGKRVWICCIDSDNDGNFREETWYVLDNDIWQPVTKYGINGSYESLKLLNINLINDGNKPSIVLKVNHVGKYEVHLIVREALNINNSILEFITTTDMQQASTLYD